MTGVATGLEIVPLLKLPAGDHTYELAPLAASVVFCPLQIVAEGDELTVTVGV